MSLLQAPIEKTCEVCFKTFQTVNRRKRTCNRSCGNVLAWRSPQTKINRSLGIRRAKASPEGRLRVNRGNDARWANPKARERLSEWNRERWSDPAYRAERSAALKELWKDNNDTKQRMSDMSVERWRDPEWRARMSARIREAKNRPEVKAAYSRLLRERWKIPAWRKVWLDRQRRFAQDPHLRAQNSERMKQLWSTDKEFRDRITGKSAVTKNIRSRLLSTVKSMADSTGCFEGCVGTLSKAVDIPSGDIARHLQSLERRGKIMVARPAGKRPALYQLLKKEKAPDAGPASGAQSFR